MKNLGSQKHQTSHVDTWGEGHELWVLRHETIGIRDTSLALPSGSGTLLWLCHRHQGHFCGSAIGIRGAFVALPSESGTLLWHCHRHRGRFCGSAMSVALSASLQTWGPGCCQLESLGTTSPDLKLHTFLAFAVLKTFKAPLLCWELLRSLVLKRSYNFGWRPMGLYP